MQEHKQQEHQQHNLQPQYDSSYSNDLQSIDEQQLDSMLNTLKKFKHIFKKKKLTNYKKEHPKVNNVFSKMSQFFNYKKNRQQSNKILTKEKCIQKRIKRLSSKINKNALIISENKPIQTNFSFDIVEDKQMIPFDNDCKNIVPLFCYICRQAYNKIHTFYGHLCPNCVRLNLQKRNQKADLLGLTALVTGGRIKIGFQIGMKLLRDGATVYVSSRFAEDTARRYQSQHDYQEFKDRLKIIQCDFLCQKQVEYLINYIKNNINKLDILINNAAQTIVRPPQFFHYEIKQFQLAIKQDNKSQNMMIIRNPQDISLPSLIANDLESQNYLIDKQHKDQFGQPLDYRTKNSWIQKIENVSLIDCYTTQVINSIVPFHLISQLKCKMVGNSPSWIINVTSMEGVYDRPYKSENHPHTNMAKASLNMITRTCAYQFRQQNIFMTSVDTGWVTNQNPHNIASDMEKNQYFKCPLDCVDGAMRVLDPVYLGLLHQQFPFGCFLKNYVQSRW